MDITTLFDSFHRLAQTLWTEFGPALAPEMADEEDAEVISYDELLDQLEMDVFLLAVARSYRVATGVRLEPEDVAARIRLHGPDGPVPGVAGQYHSHAFHPESLSGDVPRAVLTADLMARELADFTLHVVQEEPRRARSSRRGELPRH